MTGPTPGSVSSCSAVAELSETGLGARRRRAGTSAPAAPSPASRDEDLLAVADRRREVDGRALGPPRQPSGARDCVGDSRASAAGGRGRAAATAPTTSTTIAQRPDAAGADAPREPRHRPGATRSAGAAGAAAACWRRTNTRRDEADESDRGETRVAATRERETRASGNGAGRGVTRVKRLRADFVKSAPRLDDDVDELVGHDDHPLLVAVQVRPHLLGGPGTLDQLGSRAAPPEPGSGRAPCRSPAAPARPCRAAAAARRRRATASVHSRSWPSIAHSSSATCGAYGWISETAVSAANRAAGSPGAFESSLTSSITAEIGVLKTNRRSMSSVNRAIVSCALRASGVSMPVGRGGLGGRADDAPQPLDEAHHPLDAFGRPVHVLVGRAEEEDVEARRVGAVQPRSARPGRRRCRATSTSSSRPASPSPGATAAGTARGSRPGRCRSAP